MEEKYKATKIGNAQLFIEFIHRIQELDSFLQQIIDWPFCLICISFHGSAPAALRQVVFVSMIYRMTIFKNSAVILMLIYSVNG